MRFLLFIALFILFIIAFNMLSVRSMIKRTKNETFKPKEESKISKLFNGRKIDKSKAEDVKFEEIKEEK